jgi:hypothetical protein
VITVNEEARAPLSVINVNMEQVSNISSLHGVDGAENLLETTTSTKQYVCPKGTTKANADKENIQNAEFKVEIAEAYQEKINEMKATGRQQVSKGYLINLIRQKKKAFPMTTTYPAKQSKPR